jgi:hypothetical protein
MKTLRIAPPLLALAALAAAGCFLVTGQFVVNFALPTPFTTIGGSALASADIDLNSISDYSDHKDDLKRVEDLALTGDFTNNGSGTASVETWILPNGAGGLTAAQVQSQGIRLWGPLSVAAGATEHVDWNRSSALFQGRQALIDEIKGDGHFRLYLLASGAFNVTVTNGAVIAVISAGK